MESGIKFFIHATATILSAGFSVASMIMAFVILMTSVPVIAMAYTLLPITIFSAVAELTKR